MLLMNHFIALTSVAVKIELGQLHPKH
jgi:hypothetical protein